MTNPAADKRKLRTFLENLKQDFKRLFALDLEKNPCPVEGEAPRPEVIVVRNETPGVKDQRIDIMITGDEEFVANGLRAIFHTFMTSAADEEFRAEVLSMLIMDLVEDPIHRGLVMTALKTVEGAQNMKLGLQLMNSPGNCSMDNRGDLKIQGKENDLSMGNVLLPVDKSKLH